MGETPKSRRFGSELPLKLALVPAAGLAVFAFTTPAHAENASTFSVVPTSLSVSAPDGGGAIQTEPGGAQAIVASIVDSVPIEPAGDGSTADPVAAFEAAPVEQPADVPASTESPANQDTSAMPDTPTDPAVAQPAQAELDQVTSMVISSAQPSSATPEARPTASPTEPATDAVESRPSTQYQSTPKQYQPLPAVHRQPSHARRTAIAPPAKRAVREGRAHGVRESWKSVQILSLICADIDGENPVFSFGDAASKSGWNIAQIGNCIVDLPGSEEAPETVATPSECESASQYQPQEGQYQTVACAPGVGEPAGGNPTATTECIPDLGVAIDQVAPIAIVIGDVIPFDGSRNCAGPPAEPGTATAPTVASPSGPGGTDAVTGTGTPIPASPVSQPVEKPTPPVERGKPRVSHRVSGTPTVDRSSFRAWTAAAQSLPLRFQSAPAKPRSAGAKHRAPARANPETTGPPSRFGSLQAGRVERSSSSAAPGSGGSAWLAAAALLILFALSSFGLAIAGIPGPVAPALLRRIHTRITSKGLSRHPTDARQAPGPQGIRYRD